ncbi:hypothetical protein MPSEU_000905300 [Mayamaea pseudoterrestris]|nr:hypothetical protein MPSEU_000905300 [Mayamaea pseudoterrestris]
MSTIVKKPSATMISSSFRETTSADACTLTDGIRLHSVHENVIMPWIGYGTYRLGKDQATKATFQALKCGYRAIDTAFIYGGETTETLVGEAIRAAIGKGIIKDRSELFITTKHWRKYHGYEPTLECLRLSLQRLKLDYIDLWLMHWPGPAWSTMNRRNDVVAEDPWHYATTSANEMAKLRSETWRAMEDSVRAGQVRAIGVSNMTVQHLMKLKETAELWPPAVNQVELHPLYPQTDLLEYCAKEGIVVQAYSSLGGQDTGQAKWKELLGSGVQFERGSDEKTTLSTKKVNKQPKAKFDLLHASPVLDLAQTLQVTPAQVLLRWALDQNCPVIPKTTSEERMMENANALKAGQLSSEQVGNLRDTLLQQVRINNPEAVADENDSNLKAITRLAWRRDPLRHLAFE